MEDNLSQSDHTMNTDPEEKEGEVAGKDSITEENIIRESRLKKGRLQ